MPDAVSPAFALLHGGGQGSWIWDETAAALRAAGATVLALDVPGCGTKRGRETAAIAVGEIVAELAEELARSGFQDIVLVGHSQAGSIMPGIAALRPDLIRKLVYVACSAPLPGQTIVEMFGSSPRGENPDEVGWVVDPAASKAERYHAMFCNDMDRQQAEALHRRLGRDAWPPASYQHREWRYDHLAAIPSSFVLCERDNALPPAWQERFAARLHCRSIVRIDAAHQAMVTRPAELAAILLAGAE